MARTDSARMIEAMKLVLDGVTPYSAALRAGINITTMYRSRLYSMWKAGQIEELKIQMDVKRPIPRKRKKKDRFARDQP